jgi:flagellar biogenesis protein FliO
MRRMDIVAVVPVGLIVVVGLVLVMVWLVQRGR